MAHKYETQLDFELARASENYVEALARLDRCIADARRDLLLARAPSSLGVLQGVASQVDAAAGAYAALLRLAGRG